MTVVRLLKNYSAMRYSEKIPLTDYGLTTDGVWVTSNSRVDDFTAVRVNKLAGDIRRFFRRQENIRRCDLVGLRRSAQGGVFTKFLQVGFAKACVHQRRNHRPRCHAVHAYSFFG